MSDKSEHNYKRIEAAILFMVTSFKQQPSLEQIAAAVHMSPYHFQRLFTNWAGVSPKKFIQYLSLSYAKKILKQKSLSLFDTAHEVGLSGPSRLHDLFISIEAMTPGEYKQGGEGLTIRYNYIDSPFGLLLVASTSKGLCSMVFDNGSALVRLQRDFPNAAFFEAEDLHQKAVLAFFEQDWSQIERIKLHLRGTAFQLKVWEALLKIPLGQRTCYGDIARHIGNPQASRAVGTAIGSNPIAFLIPCHRVIQKSGHIGGYMWGPERKTVMLGWEAARANG